jgi:hypothetical protein
MLKKEVGTIHIRMKCPKKHYHSFAECIPGDVDAPCSIGDVDEVRNQGRPNTPSQS